MSDEGFIFLVLGIIGIVLLVAILIAGFIASVERGLSFVVRYPLKIVAETLLDLQEFRNDLRIQRAVAERAEEEARFAKARADNEEARMILLEGRR